VYPNSPTYIVLMFCVWLYMAWTAAAHGGSPRDRREKEGVLEEVYTVQGEQDSLALLQQMSMQVSADAEMTHVAEDSVDGKHKEADIHETNNGIIKGECKRAIDTHMSAVESITRSLVVLGTVTTEMATSVSELLSPAQRALLSWLKGNRVSADYELLEFSFLLSKKGFKQMYLCDPLALPPAGTATGRASNLWTFGQIFNKACSRTMYKDTLLAMDAVIQAVGDGFRCYKAGLSPRNTSAERAVALTLATIKSGGGVFRRKAPGALWKTNGTSELETSLALAITETIDFALSMPHRTRYFEAARPGIVQLLQKHFVNKSFNSTAEILMVDRKIKEHFHSDREFSKSASSSLVAQEKRQPNRRRGKCTESHRRRGQKNSNFDMHPFRKRETSKYNNGGGGGSCWLCWGRRRRARRRRTFKRDEYKKKHCPGDSEKDLNYLFETDCSYNGCSSPVDLLYRDVMAPTCALHDVCYKCGMGVKSEGFCDDVFYRNIKNECTRKKTGWQSWQRPICIGQAGIVWMAVRLGGWFSQDPDPWCKGTCAQKVAFSDSTNSVPHMAAIDDWYSR